MGGRSASALLAAALSLTVFELCFPDRPLGRELPLRCGLATGTSTALSRLTARTPAKTTGQRGQEGSRLVDQQACPTRPLRNGFRGDGAAHRKLWAALEVLQGQLGFSSEKQARWRP